MLSRILAGARLSLFVVIIAALIAATMGTLMGMVAGYFGGWVDALIMRLIDIQLAVPFILLILLVMALFGTSLANIIVIMGVASWAIYARPRAPERWKSASWSTLKPREPWVFRTCVLCCATFCRRSRRRCWCC
ncbi:Dipeptide transport system permease protein DppC (TC 3.A.1.5.2) [Cronobacter sakazakii 701]|nr:Dipeptide transport system permease protein DppC (TC 3.A.1.5.2) [Cronobacter sakazakii 701]